MTLRAGAEALGISHTALRKRIGRGKITWPPVSVEQMKAEWEENKDVLQQQRGAHSTSIPRAVREAAAASKPAPNEAPSATRPILPPGVPSQAISAAREAALKVEERALRMAREKGILLEANKVNAYIGNMIVRAADILDRLPDELADRLAQQNDPAQCRDLLRRELARARFELAEYRA